MKRSRWINICLTNEKAGNRISSIFSSKMKYRSTHLLIKYTETRTEKGNKK